MTVKPLKKFSQNFLFDQNIQKKVCDSLQTTSKSCLVEIGPGTGALSQHLVSKKAKHLCLIEFDPRCIDHLTENMLHHEHIKLYHENVLKFDWTCLPQGPLHLIGSLPYHITSPILLRTLQILNLQEAVFIIQKEVGERVTASLSTKSYGSLSVLLQSFFHTEYLFDISANAFHPKPAVTSCAIKLTPKEQKISEEESSKLQKLTQQCFQQRRKQLGTILRNIPQATTAMEDLAIDTKLRPENLSPAVFLKLALKLYP